MDLKFNVDLNIMCLCVCIDLFTVIYVSLDFFSPCDLKVERPHTHAHTYLHTHSQMDAQTKKQAKHRIKILQQRSELEKFLYYESEKNGHRNVLQSSKYTLMLLTA